MALSFVATATSQWPTEWREGQTVPHVFSTTPGRLGKGTGDDRVGETNIEWEGLK